MILCETVLKEKVNKEEAERIKKLGDLLKSRRGFYPLNLMKPVYPTDNVKKTNSVNPTDNVKKTNSVNPTDNVKKTNHLAN